MVRKLKVGDKVWGNIGRNEPYAIVKDLRYQERKVCLFNGKTHTTITDITLAFPNNLNDSYRTTRDKVYLADERVLDINFIFLDAKLRLLFEICKFFFNYFSK